MVRTMLVIRKIVDRTSYNRANIIDPIPAYPRHHSPTSFYFIFPTALSVFSFLHSFISLSRIRRVKDLKEILLGSFIFHGDASA